MSTKNRCAFIDIGSKYTKGLLLKEDGSFELQKSRSLKEVLANFVSKKNALRDVFVVATNPSFKNLPYEFSYSLREKKFTPLVEEVAQIFYKKNRQFLDKIKNKNPNEENFISSFLSRSAVDGITTLNALEMEGASFNFDFVYSIGLQNTLQALEGSLYDFNLDLKRIVPPHPFYILQLSRMINKDPQDLNCIFIDIGAKITSISSINQGSLENEGYISLGSDIFTKKIQKDFALRFRDAEKIKRFYVKGFLGGSANRKIKEALHGTFQGFANVLINTILMGFSNDRPVSKIYILGGGSAMYDINRFLQESFALKNIEVDVAKFTVPFLKGKNDFIPVASTALNFISQERDETFERIIRRSFNLS